MPSNIHRCVQTLCAIGFAVALQAQDRSLRSANKAYHALAYQRAIVHYEQAARQGASPPAFARSLADSYDRIHDAANAAKWYAVVAQLPDARDAELYAYARSLRAIGDYAGADLWLAKYQQRMATDSRVLRQQDAAGFAQRSRTASCTVSNLAINTTGNEMGPSYFGQQLVFASDRSPSVAEERLHAWNGKPFLDLFHSTRLPDGTCTEPERLAGLNTKYHESNTTFSADGTTVYFTRNNHHQGRTGTDERGVVNLRIYQRTFRNGAWCDERPFEHNSASWSVAHPCLAPQGERLYFASDMPGGQGGTDIWYCERMSDGWSAPMNLGPLVNTEGRELFPSIDANGMLSFASDGHQGLGGLDILICPIANGEAMTPYNPGAPLNSVGDDLGLVLDPTGLNGHFTSDREGGKGGDDLYAVRFAQAPYPEPKPGEGTLADGSGSISTSPSPDISDVPATSAGPQKDALPEQQDHIDPFGNVMEIAADRRVAPIHFGISQWAFGSGMAQQLDELVALLQREPHLMVRVQGHTDSRGSTTGNLVLSRRRAKSCADQLIERGIPAARVQWEGLGETRPVNDCTDGRTCEEAAHRANRRAEFILSVLE